MRASFPSHPFQGARLVLRYPLLCLIEVMENIKTESVSGVHPPKHKAPLNFFLLFKFPGDFVRAERAHHQRIRHVSGPIRLYFPNQDERLEVPWSISRKRSTPPPPCFVTSCSPLQLYLPLLHHHNYSLCPHQDAQERLSIAVSNGCGRAGNEITRQMQAGKEGLPRS